MTTKLVFLLTILIVFFKFGEPAKVMMSIYGDKGFLFQSTALTATDIVGFVYDDADGAFTFTTCNKTAVAPFTLQTDCTVVTGGVTVTPSASSTTAVAAEKEALNLKAVSAFPAAGVSTNMIAARPITDHIAITTKGTLNTASDAVVTLGTAIGSGTASVVTDGFQSLCNHLSEARSLELLAQHASTFLGIKGVSGEENNYLPIMKCVGVVRNSADAASTTISSFGTFILIVMDHADLTGRFNSLAFSSVVLFPQAINQTTAASTVVGYINGIASCSSNDNVTFQNPSTTATPSCKGTISINANGNYSFSYNGTKYYLPVTDANNEVTCPVPATTTCEDFAFNFKYSNTLIGMLLIFMLKMLQRY